MKVILLAVTSVNGKATRGTDPIIYSWTSPQDQKMYFKKLDKAQLIMMGAKTYEQAKHLIKHKKGRIRIIFTRNTKKYKKEEVPGMLEFTSDNPTIVLKKFENKGIKEALLVGGAEINSLFLKKNLVSEIHLTIEPLLFGSGKNIFEEMNFGSELTLTRVRKLNAQGTLQLIYKVSAFS